MAPRRYLSEADRDFSFFSQFDDGGVVVSEGGGIAAQIQTCQAFQEEQSSYVRNLVATQIQTCQCLKMFEAA